MMHEAVYFLVNEGTSVAQHVFFVINARKYESIQWRITARLDQIERACDCGETVYIKPIELNAILKRKEILAPPYCGNAMNKKVWKESYCLVISYILHFR